MSADDLAKGIEALEDDDVRAAVVEGDLSAFEGLELTEEEVGLLEGAASDYPDVVGFDLRAGLMNLGAPIGQKVVPTFDPIQDVTLNKQKAATKAAEAADGYLRQ